MVREATDAAEPPRMPGHLPDALPVPVSGKQNLLTLQDAAHVFRAA